MVDVLMLLEKVMYGYARILDRHITNNREWTWACLQGWLLGQSICRSDIYRMFERELRMYGKTMLPWERAMVFDEEANIWEGCREHVVDIARRMFVSVLRKWDAKFEKVRRWRLKGKLMKMLEEMVYSNEERKLRAVGAALLWMAITEAAAQRLGGEVYGWEWIRKMHGEVVSKLEQAITERGGRYDVLMWRLTRDSKWLNNLGRLIEPKCWWCWIWL